MTNIYLEIKKLKEKKNAIILAHNYQRPEVQEIADFVGDSLVLGRKALDTDAETIVFCGVYFMAETAKIINPEKRVLIPDLLAKCPMAQMLTPKDIKEKKSKYPDAEVVLYVNSSAETKAMADCVCTSANASEVVNSMESDIVIFGPDRNLAYYVEERTKKDIIIVPEWGNCPTHNQLSKDDVLRAMKRHPAAELIAHPETIPEVQRMADKIASTEGMVKYCKESDADEFIIGTENDMIYRLKRDIPEKKFYMASSAMVCPPMKSITLEKLRDSLKNYIYEVKIPENIIKNAKRAIDRMFEITKYKKNEQV